MGRPNQQGVKRQKLIPIVAGAFAELGYRRTTTAELARRCGVQENILFRLWPDKRAMFLSAIAYVFTVADKTWDDLIKDDDAGTSGIERMLAFESTHEHRIGRRRIIFAGLNEADDPEIRAALGGMYRQFHTLIEEQVREHQTGSDPDESADPDLLAWAFIGLGTMTYIGKELGLMTAEKRRDLIQQVGGQLLSAKGKRQG